MVQAYCTKERKKVTIRDPEYSLSKNNKAVVSGTCSSCGGKVQTFTKADSLPANLRAKYEAARAKTGRGQSQRASRARKSRRALTAHISKQSRRTSRKN